MFQVWVGTLNIMERDREIEKAGEKKIKKKKKGNGAKILLRYYPIAPWPWPRAKIHIGLTI